MWSDEQLLMRSSLLTVLFITLYFGLAVNQAVWFLKACFWLVLGTLKWDSVISRLPNLTTSRSSYDFTIIPVFRIFKLYITVSAVYSVDPSSFIYVKIPNLTSVLRLVSVFPYVFCRSSPCCCADDKCLPKGNNSKNKLDKRRKKVGES